MVVDEELVRDLAKRFLERLGYTVITVANGMETLELHQREQSNIGLVVLVFCFSRNWTIPHDRLAYNREGGIGRDQKEEEFFS